MARIRTVKPELWTDEAFTECSMTARVLFIGALNFANDYGVLADSPKRLKMQVFPADSVDIDPLIGELVTHGLWARDTHPDGRKVLLIRGFSKHQVVNRPNAGEFGDPTTWHEDSVSSHGTTTEQDGSVQPRKGMEGNGREGGAPQAAATTTPTSSKRGTRITADWQPPDEAVEMMRTTYPDRGIDLDLDLETAKFVDYWLAKAGKDGCKLDWTATWRNWIRRAVGDGPGVRAMPSIVPQDRRVPFVPPVFEGHDAPAKGAPPPADLRARLTRQIDRQQERATA